MSKYEHQNDSEGTINPKYIDLLDEDKPVSGQKFVCVSFISPENILKQKDQFLFEEFLKYFDFTKSMSKFTQFMNFLSYKYNLDFDKMNTDFQDFMTDEKDNLINTVVKDEYKNFLDANEETLMKDFNDVCNFQTSTRGLKVRGCYPTQEEAELRCRMLREVDPNHNVYVGPVGMWMPWEPEAYKTGRVEYLEDELNQLMHNKNENERVAKQEFEKRIKETRRKAIEENIKKAKATGNKLTQNITSDGQLVGVKNTSTIETSLEDSNETVTSADIRKELFEGDNILTREDKDKPRRFVNEDEVKEEATEEDKKVSADEKKE